VFCKHHYVYTQGHFYCTKCGHRTYGKSRKKKQVRKIAIGITGVAIAGIIGFMFVNGLFEINQENLKESIKTIPTVIPKEIQIPIKEKTDEIATNINKQIDSIKKKTEIDKAISKIPKISIPKVEIPKYEPPKEYTLEELKQIALDDINKYRTAKSLRTLILGSAVSSQLYSEELLEEGCIHHISNNGEGPMLRYKSNGDKMYLIAENISGGSGTSWMTPEQSILDGNRRMMFEDADSNWGHRDNILESGHKSVSIGIAYDSERLVMVQDFEQSLLPGYQYDPSSFQKEPVDNKLCW